MKRIFQALTGMALGLSLSWAHADEERISVTSGEFRNPMVELYTSEGCSSCPTADDWLRRLGNLLNEDFRGVYFDAVPLAFHVDYWNYLGWTDPYSTAQFTKRQREAPANLRRGGIYTPEFLADGLEVRGGTDVLRSIRMANLQKAEATIRVDVERDESASDGADNIEARIDVDNRAGAGNTRAYLAIYESGITREIGAGENAGKTLQHDFVVRHWSRPVVIRPGANSAGLDVKIPADWKRPNLGLAVVVVDINSGKTVQAVRTSLAPLFSG